MTNKILELIKEKYPLTPVDAGKFAKLTVNGMTFKIEAYKAAGLGHVSIMRAKGFFGLMKMDTLIVNPTEIDLPLYSYDRIFAMGNDTLIVELYDTIVDHYDDYALSQVKTKYDDLPERDPGEHWYDSIKLDSSISKKGRRITDKLDSLALEHFSAYLSSSDTPVSDRKAKMDNASRYVVKLVGNGGPSTDVFIKKIGLRDTADLFVNILFGVD